MDGLSIRNGQNLLESGKTLGEVRTNEMLKPDMGVANSGKSFADTLKDAVANVNKLEKEADVKMQKLATGKTNDIPDVLIAVEKADIAFRLMTQVRNKVIDAYQEIMKMQV